MERRQEEQIRPQARTRLRRRRQEDLQLQTRATARGQPGGRATRREKHQHDRKTGHFTRRPQDLPHHLDGRPRRVQH